MSKERTATDALVDAGRAVADAQHFIAEASQLRGVSPGDLVIAMNRLLVARAELQIVEQLSRKYLSRRSKLERRK